MDLKWAQIYLIIYASLSWSYCYCIWNNTNWRIARKIFVSPRVYEVLIENAIVISNSKGCAITGNKEYKWTQVEEMMLDDWILILLWIPALLLNYIYYTISYF